jgi:hypothetical protein
VGGVLHQCVYFVPLGPIPSSRTKFQFWTKAEH